MSEKDKMTGYDELDLPFSLEAEQAVLGAIIIDGEVVDKVAGILPNAKYFYVNTHRDIYAAVLDLFFKGETIDRVMLLEKLKKNKVFDENTEKTFLMDLAENCPAASNAAEYAVIVREKYNARQFINALREAIHDTFEGTKELPAHINELEKRIIDIRNDTVNSLEPLSKALVKEFNRLDASYRNSDSSKPIPTGFGGLDKVITGLERSDLILLAARPGMGKTSFALNIARNIAVECKKAVAFFSLEMGTKQLVSRLISAEASVHKTKLHTGELSDEEWAKIVRAGEVISNSDIYLDDTPRITVAEIKSKLKQLKKVDFVVIDYLQLMISERAESRVQEVSEITKSLKTLAKELNVPVLCVSQLSRAPEKRADHRPMISDLGTSDSIIQYADIVLLLYREGYYANLNDSQNDDNSGECIVAKNNCGKTANIMLNWQGDYMRFESTN